MGSCSLGRRAVRCVGVAAIVSVAGCTVFEGPDLRPGQSVAEIQAQLGAFTGRYELVGGRTRQEFARGPFGRQTWMVDIDASGRVIVGRQVLTDTNLMAVQGLLPGMTIEELLRTLGRPGQRRGGGWQGGEVWSWRYATNDCLWFQVSIGDDRIVRDGAFGPDPLCDRDVRTGLPG